MVEFALISPVFFLILFGIIEMGRMVYVNHQIDNGTREGARYALVRGTKSGMTTSSTDVENYMLTKMAGVSGGALNVTLSYPDGSLEPGKRVRVTSTYAYQPFLTMVCGGGTIQMSQTSTVIIAH